MSGAYFSIKATGKPNFLHFSFYTWRYSIDLFESSENVRSVRRGQQLKEDTIELRRFNNSVQ